MNRVLLVRWLAGHTRTLLPPLALSVLARVANQLLGVALLVVAASVLVRVGAGDAPSAPTVIAWLAALALLKALLRYLEHYCGHWVAFTALHRLRQLFFARLVPQAPAATTGRAGAELTAAATRDIDRIEVFFAHTLPPAISAIVVPAVSLIWLALAVDVRLAAVLAPFIVLIVVLVPAVSQRATWRGARRIAAARGALAAHIGDDIQGVREVRAFEIEEVRLDGLDAADRRLGDARVAAGRIQAARSAANILLQLGALLTAAAVAGQAGIPETDLAIALAVAVGLVVPARGISDFTAGLDAAFAAAERVRAIVEAEPLVQDTGRLTQIDADAVLSAESVSLRYPGADRAALDGVTARFVAGQWSYVVGVSGSGKSTLAEMLLRGWDPTAGRVSIGGTDLREFRLETLRTHVALVSQRPSLLSASIADNLRLGAPDADEQTLRRALHLADLDTWVDELPEGIRTRIGGRSGVSGGQLQRLALARAIVASPRVLVLDEALSQLDETTADRVRQRIARLDPPLTVIEITHRADRIPGSASVTVIDRGGLVETGTADALRAQGSAFSRLEARTSDERRAK